MGENDKAPEESLPDRFVRRQSEFSQSFEKRDAADYVEIRLENLGLKTINAPEDPGRLIEEKEFFESDIPDLLEIHGGEVRPLLGVNEFVRQNLIDRVEFWARVHWSIGECDISEHFRIVVGAPVVGELEAPSNEVFPWWLRDVAEAIFPGAELREQWSAAARSGRSPQVFLQFRNLSVVVEKHGIHFVMPWNPDVKRYVEC